MKKDLQMKHKPNPNDKNNRDGQTGEQLSAKRKHSDDKEEDLIDDQAFLEQKHTRSATPDATKDAPPT